ncbi:MAG: dockerin type I domain-containing protein [Saprospiraceae bacterium]
MKKHLITAFAVLLLFTAYSQNPCEGDTIAPNATFVSLSSALLQNHEVQLWAIDFIKTSSDNCSPTNQLKYTFNEEKPIAEKLMEVHYFKGNGLPGSEYEFSIGKAQRWNPNFRSSEKVFQTCFLIAKLINLKTTVWDEAFNSTTGNTQTTFIDQNPDPCHLVNFHVTTVKGEGLTQFEARLEAGVPEFPRFFTGDHTLTANVPVFGTEICANVKKETNANNGVGINDLILLRNHILGLKKITDPYQLIAADVNNDNKLTAADLTELKRMLYGFQSSFSKTHSWIIIKKDYVFSNPQNPWQNLSWKDAEKCFTYAQGDDDTHVYYLAIKAGDIDQTAKP